jgi:hypothetical protein
MSPAPSHPCHRCIINHITIINNNNNNNNIITNFIFFKQYKETERVIQGGSFSLLILTVIEDKIREVLGMLPSKRSEVVYLVLLVHTKIGTS